MAEGRAKTRGDETVLVVDDQPEILGLLVELLTEDGYHVVPARGGAEALKACQNEDLAVHLVLTDLKMPQISGVALVEALSKNRRGVKVLFMSGYGDDVAGFSSADNFIQKPFKPEALLVKVRETLDGQKPAET